MTPGAAVLMASYNRWMNQRLYQAAATLTEEEIARDRGAFFGSILRTLNHIAIADTIWLNRFSQSEDAVFLHGALAAFPAPRALDQPLAVSLRGLEQHRAALDQVICDWSHTLTQIYRAGYKDEEPISVRNGTYIPSNWDPDVDSDTTYNYSLTYRGFDKLRVTFGIKNLFDSDPPFTAHMNDYAAGAGWEPRVADPRGRAYTLELSYKFL